MDVPIPKKKWPLARLLLLAGGLLLIGLLTASVFTARSAAGLRVDTRRLTISPVSRGAFQEFTALDGVVKPMSTTYLDAAEDGTVQELLVEEGATLTPGQPILRLANTNLQLEMVNRETAVFDLMNNLQNTRNQLVQNRMQRQSQLTDLDFQLAEAQRLFDTNAALYAEKVIARQDYIHSQNAYRYLVRKRALARQDLRQDSVAMQQQVGKMQASLSRMNSNLALMRHKMDGLLVRAPVGGRLTSLNAEVGGAQARGKRLGQIDALTGFKIQATVDEFYISRIVAGQLGELLVDGTAYPMHITKIYPQVTKGLQVDLQFSRAVPPGLRRGQTLPVRLALSEKASAVLLPKGGFYQQTVGNWVFKVNQVGTGAQRVAVRLGRQNPEYFEVLAGLQPGDRVITSSYEGYEGHAELTLSAGTD